ncbi:hypothetical protein F4861DRAFT_530076 [Xylaria intraflava]|nr:hypothetical protein F4861DRAFT_530076 [Xylaria intraflava]
MFRGNLSDLRRGAASSGRARPSRGFWLGNRGGPYRGRGSTGKVHDQTPLGPLITEFTPEDTASATASEGDARITNCEYAASYSLTDEKPLKLIVPGQPPAWKPPALPCLLPKDSGDYLRDHNGALFPDHPIQPAVQALFALNKKFDTSTIDIMGCASTLGDILRFVRSIDSTFRFDVELIGNTLFLIRNCKDDVIPDVYGYGHSFLDAFTSSDPNGGTIKSHQRVVSYDFGGLKCLVRFECDGRFIGEDTHDTPVTELPFDTSPQELPGSITLHKAGTVVPQNSVLEIKTKSARGVIEKSDHLPRLWVRQIPHLITSYHVQGTFKDFKIEDIRKESTEWETQHQDELKKFASVLRQLITEIKKVSHLKLELYRAGTGPLQLRERRGAPRQALPRSLEDRWIAPPKSTPEYAVGRDDSDEDSETYPSSRASSEGSYVSAADFSFDYTACSPDCGYCGRCAY